MYIYILYESAENHLSFKIIVLVGKPDGTNIGVISKDLNSHYGIFSGDFIRLFIRGGGDRGHSN